MLNLASVTYYKTEWDHLDYTFERKPIKWKSMMWKYKNNLQQGRKCYMKNLCTKFKKYVNEYSRIKSDELRQSNSNSADFVLNTRKHGKDFAITSKIANTRWQKRALKYSPCPQGGSQKYLSIFFFW